MRVQAPSHSLHTGVVEANIFAELAGAGGRRGFEVLAAPVQVINKRKNEKPEARKATREAALREACLPFLVSSGSVCQSVSLQQTGMDNESFETVVACVQACSPLTRRIFIQGGLAAEGLPQKTHTPWPALCLAGEGAHEEQEAGEGVRAGAGQEGAPWWQGGREEHALACTTQGRQAIGLEL